MSEELSVRREVGAKLAAILEMASLCQKCGDGGYRELLEYCTECKTSAQHRYCLEKIPKRDEEVQWICELCKPISPKTVSFAELVVYSDRNEDELDGEQNPLSSDRKARLPGCPPKVILPQVQKIHSHSNTLTQQKIKVSVSSVSQIEATKRDHPHTLSEKGKHRRLKKRRLVILDEEPLGEKLPSDSGNQNARVKASVVPIEPLSALQPAEVTIGSRIAEVDATTNVRVHQEVSVPQSNILCNRSSVSQQLYLAAQPLIDHCWRGCFSFGTDEYGPLTAHISSKACERAVNVAKLLPPTLHMEKLPRLDSWPNSFKRAPLTDDKIALYFFPASRRVDPMFDRLVGHAISEDLVFKFVLDEAELLVFASTLLPEDHQRFQGKHYPWGVFRRRQDPVQTVLSKSHSPLTLLVKDAASYPQASDKGESDGHGQESSDVTEPSPRSAASPQSCVLHRTEGNELAEEIHKPEDSSKIEARPKFSARSKDEKKLQLVDESDCAGEQEEGEIYNEYGDEREEGEFCAEDYERLCLQLFPLNVEDMGIVARVGSEKDLDLELGLSRRSCAKVKDHFDGRGRKCSKVP